MAIRLLKRTQPVACVKAMWSLDEDGTLAIEVKPGGSLAAQASIAHLGCRVDGPIMETWIGPTFGEPWWVV